MKPMDANPLKSNKYNSIIGDTNYIIEEKLKGIRATIKFGRPSHQIFSRGGHDISHRFPHISQAVINPNLLGVELDGELFQRGIEDEVIAGWGNWRTKNIDPSVTKGVKFHYFDILLHPQRIHIIDSALLLRKYVLDKVATLLNPQDLFIHMEWKRALDAQSTQHTYNEIIANGGEGIMLKNIHSLYYPGKRPQNVWYKMKKTKTFDVVITGFEMAKETSIKKGHSEFSDTKFKGLIGAFKYGMYAKFPWTVLKELGTCSGMDDATRIDMTQNPHSWLGQVVEIEGVEQKTSGAIDNPRFKRQRLDKEAKECTMTQVTQKH
jgi:ATP-dependent DNA ligase